MNAWLTHRKCMVNKYKYNNNEWFIQGPYKILPMQSVQLVLYPNS